MLSLKAPFFYRNPPETGKGRNGDHVMRGDRYNFTCICRMHVAIDHKIGKFLQPVVDSAQTKFWGVPIFVKNSHFLKAHSMKTKTVA